jgi:hypothetical protein
MQHAGKVIHIHAHAPPKPPLGQTCNGCGQCCLAVPCPLGALLSGARSGACKAVRWEEPGNRYRCGAVTAPAEVLRQLLPGFLQGLVRPLAWLLGPLARRWIAAGAGCDSTIETYD